MLNIELIPETEIIVFACTNPVSVTRVGDICLADDLSCRPPWEYLFVSKDSIISTGIFNKHTQMDINIISLNSNSYKINQLYNLSKQQFTLALVQKNSRNEYQAAINTGCRIAGSELPKKGIAMAFSVHRCEMICDQ